MKVQGFSLALVLSLCAAPALADVWTIDSAHSSAQFKVRHMMVSNVNGNIGGVKGTADFDGKNLTSLKVDAELDPSTINTNEPDRDKHLRSADFFDCEKYPKMTFKSKKVVETAPNKYKLFGDLTMHGVTKEVALDMQGPSQIIKDPHGGERMGAEASTTINRKDFGITYNKVLDGGGVAVSDDVQITLDIELKKAKAATEAAKHAG